MHSGMFGGLTRNFGDPMTFKVCHCNTNPHKQKVVVPRNLEAIGYNSTLAPKRDAHSPEVHYKIPPLANHTQLDIRGLCISPIVP